MNSYFIGKVDEVQPVDRKNKDTGQVTMFAQLTVTFEATNTKGFLVKSTENIQLDINQLGQLQNAKGKFIAVPYTTINTKAGTYTFPDDNLEYIVLDKNPLEIPVKKTA